MKQYIIISACCLVMVTLLVSFIGNDPVDKAELGRLLFFDPILSRDSTISCASCHRPDRAFADTLATSIGVGGHRGVRNTPSAMNVSLRLSFFWDGRAKTLEEQALAPIQNPVEMNLPLEEALLRLQQNKNYKAWFKKLFDSGPTLSNLAAALAIFERGLETSESPFDEWKFSDDSTAVSEAVKRGFNLFNTKGNCVKCHFGADLTANEFRNIGLFNGRDLNDSGRMAITRKQEDIGKFKTPSLRNVAITAPYMHDGRFRNLKEVIDFYDAPDKVINNSINRDSIMAKPFGLTAGEKSDLETFLNSLTDKRFSPHKN